MKFFCQTFSCATLFLLMLTYGTVATAIPPQQSETVTLIDSDGTRVTLTEEELRKMPQLSADQCIWVGKTSGYIGIFDYAGTSLTSVLRLAKSTVSAEDYRQENSYVIFRGTDGYQIIASWTELMDSPDGHRAMIGLERNGEPLPASEGRFRLVLPGDKYVGRSVKWLETIEIRLAEGFAPLSKKSEDSSSEASASEPPQE